jgi:alpha-tubulin suppressor-like RCC1 family protein
VPEILSGITHVGAGGSFTCARISTSGTIKCLGDNQFGQLGNGTTSGTNIPTDVSGITTANTLALGYFHACALLSTGGIKCWGDNLLGKLGDGSGVTSTTTPVDVTGISTATLVTAGNNHTCALITGGSIRCWGDGLSGQLGDGSNTSETSTPVTVSNISNAISVSAGSAHTCALVSGGVQCWGKNDFGQLGNGSASNANVPVAVSGITTAIAVSSGG